MFFRNTNWKYVMEDIVDFFRRLAIRRWINTNPRPVIFITNISVIVFVLVLLHTLNSGNSARNWEPRKDWFYDLNTDALFCSRQKIGSAHSCTIGTFAERRIGRSKGVCFQLCSRAE